MPHKVEPVHTVTNREPILLTDTLQLQLQFNENLTLLVSCSLSSFPASQDAAWLKAAINSYTHNVRLYTPI